MNKKISVIMSTYGKSQYLDEAIKSILTQSCQNFEFIIVNDFADKLTKKKLYDFKKKDPRIKIINNKKNLGLTKSLIKAINSAKGEFIARIDSDDFSEKDRLKLQLEWFEKSKKRVLCGTNFFVLNDSGDLLKKNVLNDHKSIKKNMIYKNCFVHSSTMFKLNTYKKIGGYNKIFKFSQDYALWSRFIHEGEVGNLKKRLTFIRNHKKSVSHLKSIEQTMSSILISCDNYHFMKKKKFLKFKKGQINFRCVEKILILKNFLKSMIFLNRKKLKNIYKVSLYSLSFESLIHCLKQPKMFLYNLYYFK